MTPEQHLEHVRELAAVKSQVENIANDVNTIVEKLDLLFTLQREMTRIEQEQCDHRDSLKRAFERIENGEKLISGNKENTDKWVNRGLGGWVVGAILIGIIQWLVVDRVRSYESTQTAHTEMMVTFDRRMSWVEYELKKHKKDEVYP